MSLGTCRTVDVEFTKSLASGQAKHILSKSGDNSFFNYSVPDTGYGALDRGEGVSQSPKDEEFTISRSPIAARIGIAARGRSGQKQSCCSREIRRGGRERGDERCKRDRDHPNRGAS